MSLHALVPESRRRSHRPAGITIFPTLVASRIRHPVSYRASVHFPVRAPSATTSCADRRRRVAGQPAAPEYRIVHDAYTGVS
ncbi:hypothetical protein WI69_16765 [Burkholderia diffusa]|uniref:hypothetical protein n=1 Tax=Burkholderia diffusa TaxID=488732 RepID=UPI00075A1F73|nr:hypothetical protein [Burkholderia diffusa]KUZ17259.1 hypothetical protein WI28_06290 [Burkholderia diffusa]KVC17101.1 hypothetical protein WI69_16765 [Burkholderia diffusa]KVG28993.1 hypothetical protein WJ30_01330 [Burkholderia diffusa]KVH48627.1 hypothetical protein WJ39_12180 [Burkholderia diffusa]